MIEVVKSAEYIEMQGLSVHSLRDYCRGVKLWCNVAEIDRLNSKWRLFIYLLAGGVNKRKAKQVIYKDFELNQIPELRLFIAQLKNAYPSLIVENYVLLYMESIG